MNLTELRDSVRTQLQLDEVELPNSAVDFYLRAAFDITVQAERQWPFLEKQWDLTTVAGVRAVAVPEDYRAHHGVYHQETGPLRELDHGFAIDNFGSIETADGYPQWISRFGGFFYLWPNLEDAVHTLIVIGVRAPLAFPINAADSPDCDRRLDIALVWYACSLAKQQEEDEVLAAEYKTLWQDALAAARADIMRVDELRPRFLNSRPTSLSYWAP